MCTLTGLCAVGCFWTRRSYLPLSVAEQLQGGLGAALRRLHLLAPSWAVSCCAMAAQYDEAATSAVADASSVRLSYRLPHASSKAEGHTGWYALIFDWPGCPEIYVSWRGSDEWTPGVDALYHSAKALGALAEGKIEGLPTPSEAQLAPVRQRPVVLPRIPLFCTRWPSCAKASGLQGGRCFRVSPFRFAGGSCVP